MYELTISNRLPVSISLDVVKNYIGVTAADEDVVITNLIESAVAKAESYTGMLFASQSVTIVTDALFVNLGGKVKADSLKVIGSNGVEVDYLQHGNRLTLPDGVNTITYDAEEWLPNDLITYVLQAVGAMYARGGEVIKEPDMALLNRYKNFVIC